MAPTYLWPFIACPYGCGKSYVSTDVLGALERHVLAEHPAQVVLDQGDERLDGSNKSARGATQGKQRGRANDHGRAGPSGATSAPASNAARKGKRRRSSDPAQASTSSAAVAGPSGTQVLKPRIEIRQQVAVTEVPDAPSSSVLRQPQRSREDASDDDVDEEADGRSEPDEPAPALAAPAPTPAPNRKQTAKVPRNLRPRRPTTNNSGVPLRKPGLSGAPPPRVAPPSAPVLSSSSSSASSSSVAPAPSFASSPSPSPPPPLPAVSRGPAQGLIPSVPIIQRTSMLQVRIPQGGPPGTQQKARPGAEVAKRLRKTRTAAVAASGAAREKDKGKDGQPSKDQKQDANQHGSEKTKKGNENGKERESERKRTSSSSSPPPSPPPRKKAKVDKGKGRESAPAALEKSKADNRKAREDAPPMRSRVDKGKGREEAPPAPMLPPPQTNGNSKAVATATNGRAGRSSSSSVDDFGSGQDEPSKRLKLSYPINELRNREPPRPDALPKFLVVNPLYHGWRDLGAVPGNAKRTAMILARQQQGRQIITARNSRSTSASSSVSPAVAPQHGASTGKNAQRAAKPFATSSKPRRIASPPPSSSSRSRARATATPNKGATLQVIPPQSSPQVARALELHASYPTPSVSFFPASGETNGQHAMSEISSPSSGDDREALSSSQQQPRIQKTSERDSPDSGSGSMPPPPAPAMPTVQIRLTNGIAPTSRFAHKSASSSR